MQMTAIPKALSVGEETFAYHCRVNGLSPVREFTFAAGRKYRFDFAFVGLKIGIEIEGGTWMNGRHSRGAGFERDCRKYNCAALDGWRVFRFTTLMVESGEAINDVLTAIGSMEPV